MNDVTCSPGNFAAQIDRLVSGDLPEADRRRLVVWLEEEPQRWRACGLAFLEAQLWEQAVGVKGRGTEDWGHERADRGQRTAEWAGTQPAPGRLRHWLAIAGMVLAAFAVGLASGRHLPGGPARQPQFAQPSFAQPSFAQPHDRRRGTEPLVATVSVRTNLNPRVHAELRLPIADAGGGALSGEPAISDYERQQWERKGFELIEEVRYLPARLPDGRQVMVPVTKVHVKYKGTPVS
jgi:hypothetical protein